ncbi:MAG: hypothetical protein O3C60_20360 [Planctomycetota bacterium]|nr:hypothetical protein [Planctomycetota bacterium]
MCGELNRWAVGVASIWTLRGTYLLAKVYRMNRSEKMYLVTRCDLMKKSVTLMDGADAAWISYRNVEN